MLMIPKGSIESVNKKKQAMQWQIQNNKYEWTNNDKKTLHRKLKIKQHLPH